MNGLDRIIPPQEIITMDWLVENVIGSIPSISDLTEEARAVVKMQGLSITQVGDA